MHIQVKRQQTSITKKQKKNKKNVIVTMSDGKGAVDLISGALVFMTRYISGKISGIHQSDPSLSTHMHKHTHTHLSCVIRKSSGGDS